MKSTTIGFISLPAISTESTAGATISWFCWNANTDMRGAAPNEKSSES